MKTQLWVYIVVAVLSLGAGVAIAGVPTFEEREATIEAPAAASTTSSGDAAASETTDSDAVADEDASPSEPAETNGDVAVDASSAAQDEPEPEPDEPVEEATSTTTTTTTVPLIDRAILDMAAANGANVGGAASNASAALEAAGYTDVASFDGEDIVEVTVIFAAEGLQAEAERLAEDIGIETNLIFPLSGAPGVGSLPDQVEIVVYLGRNVVDLDFFN